MANLPSADKLPLKQVVMKGNRMVNFVNVFSNIKMVMSKLPYNINNLEEFVLEELDDSPRNKIIIKQIRFVQNAAYYISERINLITSKAELTATTRQHHSKNRVNQN